MTRNLVIFPLAGLLIASVAFAQEAPPRPGDMDDRSAMRERYRRRWDDRRWEEAIQFLQEHSPRRWAAYEALPDGQKDRVRSAILRRHSRLERIREHSPEDAYEMVIRRVQLEDEAWGLGQDIRNTEDEATRQALRKQLEQVVQTMVTEQFLEREQRIKRLQKAVAIEEKRLAEDRDQAGRLVEKQMDQIIATDHPMVDPNAPPPPDGEDGMEPGPDKPGNRSDRPRRPDAPGPPR